METGVRACPRVVESGVRHPQRIRAPDLELPIHPVIRALAMHHRARGLHPPAPHRPPGFPPAGACLQTHPAHQSSHRAARHRYPLTAKLAPDLAHPVHLEVFVVHPAYLPAQPSVTTRPRRHALRLGFTCLVRVVRRWGDRHLRAQRPDPVSTSMSVDERHHHLARRSSSAWAKYADALRRIRHLRAQRPDPVSTSMSVDERHHHLARRSSSAWAKYADALRRISFARRNSRFSRSSSLSRCRSLLVSPARTPRSHVIPAKAGIALSHPLA